MLSTAIASSADTAEYIESRYTVYVDGIGILRPTVAVEIDSDEMIVSGSKDKYEKYKDYAEKINAAIKNEGDKPFLYFKSGKPYLKNFPNCILTSVIRASMLFVLCLTSRLELIFKKSVNIMQMLKRGVTTKSSLNKLKKAKIKRLN